MIRYNMLHAHCINCILIYYTDILTIIARLEHNNNIIQCGIIIYYYYIRDYFPAQYSCTRCLTQY